MNAGESEAMYVPQLRKLSLGSDSDFRAKATFGVALAALCLLFPVAILNLIHDRYLTGIGSLGIVILLAANVWLVFRGRCHQSLTLFILVPAGMSFMITVFSYDGIIGSLWCYPSIIGCYCMLSERRAWLANFIIIGVCIPMTATTLPAEYSIRIAATILAISIFSAILVRVIDNLNKKLKHQLIHDPLTGLLNRLTLKEKLEHAITLYQDRDAPTSILAIDVDYFKHINDHYGHDAGDRALMKLASVLTENLRAYDYAFRTGGEEFLVLLNTTGEKEANLIAERLRCEVEASDIIPHQSVTISIGVTSYAEGESWTGWMKRADDHLYTAKQTGRNRVALSNGRCKVVPITNVASKRVVTTSDI